MGVESSEPSAALDAILALVKERVGTDFSCYRRATVQRRVQGRMLIVGAESLPSYLRLLETSAEETGRLIERITIKVSRFFRNAATFELLRQEIVPAMARERRGQPLRTWSAGCGQGEEAYSVAMVLDESGVDWSVLATDIDDQALGVARVGQYPSAALAELPPGFGERYFERGASSKREGLGVRAHLRERVRFARHDLTCPQAPLPGGPFELICCRNVLIYLQRSMQERVLERLREAVAPGGYLLLGEAEWPSPKLDGLTAVHPKARIFRVRA